MDMYMKTCFFVGAAQTRSRKTADRRPQFFSTPARGLACWLDIATPFSSCHCYAVGALGLEPRTAEV